MGIWLAHLRCRGCVLVYLPGELILPLLLWGLLVCAYSFIRFPYAYGTVYVIRGVYRRRHKLSGMGPGAVIASFVGWTCLTCTRCHYVVWRASASLVCRYAVALQIVTFLLCTAASRGPTAGASAPSPALPFLP